ncbi:MAG: DNA polymerase III subunit alpha, partial [Candidatus Babeliales bacterium]
AQKAEQLFDLMAYFAGYGFNKSHSAAYAMIAYQTAYLKAHYPAEFMACLISLEATHPEKMSFYLQEAKEMHLPMLPPDINRSGIHFTVVQGTLLFGLQGIKNVGDAALEAIIHEREKKPYKSLMDFCIRIDLRTANKRVIESLICAGAFDAMPGNRAQKYDELGTIMEQAAEKKRALLTGQMGLFGGQQKSDDDDNDFAFTPRAEWENKEKLDKEREVIGFYLSAHPLDAYKNYFRWFNIPSFEANLEKTKQINSLEDPVVIGCGLLTQAKQIVTKKGDRMAFVQLEDVSSKSEVIIFPKLFAKVEAWLQDYKVFMVKGALDVTSQNQCKIKADQIVPLELIFHEWHFMQSSLILPEQATNSLLELVKKNLIKGKIPLHVILKEHDRVLKIKTKETIALDTTLVQELEKHEIKVAFSL